MREKKNQIISSPHTSLHVYNVLIVIKTYRGQTLVPFCYVANSLQRFWWPSWYVAAWQLSKLQNQTHMKILFLTTGNIQNFLILALFYDEQKTHDLDRTRFVPFYLSYNFAIPTNSTYFLRDSFITSQYGFCDPYHPRIRCCLCVHGQTSMFLHL